MRQMAQLSFVPRHRDGQLEKGGRLRVIEPQARNASAPEGRRLSPAASIARLL